MPRVVVSFTPAAVRVVIEFNLVRAGSQRHRNLADERVPVLPVVEHQLLVEVEPVAAVLSRTLNEDKIISGSAGREVTRPPD